MSSWMSDFGIAEHGFGERSWRASVLPTPVGPSNANVPMGRCGSFRSARERRSALQMADDGFLLADDHLGHLGFHRRASVCASPCSMRLSGMPVHLATTWRMSSSSTLTRFSSRLDFQALRTASCFSLACFSLSRMAAAPSKSCSLMAFSFRVLISSISASMSLTSGGRVIAPMRAREPASSIRSMALSGR